MLLIAFIRELSPIVCCSGGKANERLSEMLVANYFPKMMARAAALQAIIPRQQVSREVAGGSLLD